MPKFSGHEIAFAQLKVLIEKSKSNDLKLFLDELIKTYEEKKVMKKTLKKLEISIYPPKITVEFEFPYKDNQKK